MLEQSDCPLAELKLGWNGISEQGALDLAMSLARNSSVLELDLQWNRLGEAGAALLGDALRQNSTL
jgi:Ran GTPase-activating protein (RanGAP) involved in mRNA processing and transport